MNVFINHLFYVCYSHLSNMGPGCYRFDKDSIGNNNIKVVPNGLAFSITKFINVSGTNYLK
jgi:hypothetical protein